MFADIAHEALRLGKRLELRYHGFSRVVEVHAIGISTAGNAIMSVYQVRGGSLSGERVGWKNMLFDESFTAHIIEEESAAPRPGYRRDAQIFRSVTCQL